MLKTIEGVQPLLSTNANYITSYALITTPSFMIVITIIHDVSTGRRPPRAVDQEDEYPEHSPQLSGSVLFYSDSQKYYRLFL